MHCLISMTARSRMAVYDSNSARNGYSRLGHQRTKSWRHGLYGVPKN